MNHGQTDGRTTRKHIASAGAYRRRRLKNWKLGFRCSVSKNRLRRFGEGFSSCFIHTSSCSMIGSTVTVFFFVPYLYTFGSESLWLKISWTNSSWKYVISSFIHIKQHTEQKTKTAVNLVKPKPNRKPQFFGKPNRKPNGSHFFANCTPLQLGSHCASVSDCWVTVA